LAKSTLTEAAIQRGLVEALQWAGFTVYHTRFSLGSTEGFPDILAVDERGQQVVIECKGPRGRVSTEQLEWLARFDKVPGVVFCAIVGPETKDGWVGYDDALAMIRHVGME